MHDYILQYVSMPFAAQNLAQEKPSTRRLQGEEPPMRRLPSHAEAEKALFGQLTLYSFLCTAFARSVVHCQSNRGSISRVRSLPETGHSDLALKTTWGGG